MRKTQALLRCRTCRQTFRATRMPDGGWRREFPRKPPSPICRSHRGSPLCRWEVHRFRQRLWKNIELSFEGQPVAYVTLVPPRRIVPFDALPQARIENEARSLQRLLKGRLPTDTVAVGIFDVSLVDDQRDGQRKRYWQPHFHVLVAGITVAKVEELCDGLYAATEKVPCPVDVRDAPSPCGALAYSLKHVGDVKVRAIFDRKGNAAGKGKNTQQPGKRKRRMKADERAMVERWAQQQTLDDYLPLKGLRRFGSKVRRV